MTMPCLPPELVQSIIDFLHDNPEALKRCSLVSKSWIFFARKHLFNHINFKYRKHLDAWKKNCMGSKTSPATYTHSLWFRNANLVTKEDIGWIRSFTAVKRLEILTWDFAEGSGPTTSLAPFCSLSSAVELKSLCVGWCILPLREVFDLICSFPLENLHIVGTGRIDGPDDLPSAVRSSMLPGMSGTLMLEPAAPDIVQKLLELPSGLRFRKIVHKPGYAFRDESSAVKRLVEKCADTLENIEISILNPIDLSEATKLKEAEFWFNLQDAAQVATTLKTITSKDFKRLSIHFCPQTIDVKPGGQIASEWSDLDHVLVKLQEMRSVCVKIVLYGYAFTGNEDIKCLLPEAMKGGSELDLPEYQKFFAASCSNDRWYRHGL